MSVENRVFNKLFKESKIELSAKKIELSIVDDINDLSIRMNLVVNDLRNSSQISESISKERKKVITDLKVSVGVGEKYISEYNKVITNAKKVAKEFGAPVTDLKGYKALDKSISTLSRSIDVANGSITSLS